MGLAVDKDIENSYRNCILYVTKLNERLNMLSRDM